MREIKFRGKRTDGKGWAYGYLVENEQDIYRTFIVTSARWDVDEDGCTDLLETEVYEVIPKTVGQYTEFKDKDKIEIYEGDIMTDDVNNYAVVFYEGAWRLKLNAKNGDTWWKSLNRYTNKLKVIGNIDDNSELLKEGN